MAGLNKASKLIGANEDMFLQAFDSTPTLNIATQKKLENELAKVITTISNTNADWDQRVQAMRLFRSLVNSGITDHDDFYTTTLRNLEVPFQNNICDLRSQVVRETCITIAYLSCRLQQKFSRMAEILLPSLIKLIPNSAKIVSTSALVALRFIIQSTHSSKFITIFKYQLSTSKSKDIHRALCEIVERIATTWPAQIIERHINEFVEVLRLGICDSDEMARQYSRRAFNAFAENFREQADRLFNSLDGQRQRMLNNLNHGGGSTLSINGYGGSTTSGHSTQVISRLKSSLTASSNGNSSPSSSASSGSSVPAPQVQALSHVYQTTRVAGSPSRIRTPTARSTSAIDVDAQRRARARAVYLNSMYQRPRQLGGTLNNNNNNIKSSLPQPIHQASPINHSQFSDNFTASAQHLKVASSTPIRQSPSTTLFHTPQSLHRSNIQCNDQRKSPIIIPQQQQQQQQQQSQPQQQQVALTQEKTGDALSKAAAYLLSVMKDSRIDDSQIVTTIKYFNTLIDKHPSEIISHLMPELMPPLTISFDNAAILVRKATVFAMVSIYAKVGLKEMEPYLTNMTSTQRNLLEIYCKKHDEENQSKIN